MSEMKQVLEQRDPPAGHWVGDGFPVRSLFSYADTAEALSPFLLLDYAGPAEFPAAGQPRGVGPHPHRGFETVTLVYRGEVAHRDSTGQGGIIGPGDVQWMTAGSGILHEEFHSADFTRRGGLLEMVQLWVNLPARSKLTPPRYQAIRDGEIPRVAAGPGAVLRVIAGSLGGVNGPARTHTPMLVGDLALAAGATAELELTAGWTGALAVLQGTVQVNQDQVGRAAGLFILDRNGTRVRLEANNEVRLLVLAGQPLAEPVVGHGPFVMNTRDEIRQAIEDFNLGRFGRMS
jgi:redox-sensitive bicupin YhaK (pirin superfamily)